MRNVGEQAQARQAHVPNQLFNNNSEFALSSSACKLRKKDSFPPPPRSVVSNLVQIDRGQENIETERITTHFKAMPIIYERVRFLYSKDQHNLSPIQLSLKVHLHTTRTHHKPHHNLNVNYFQRYSTQVFHNVSPIQTHRSPSNNNSLFIAEIILENIMFCCLNCYSDSVSQALFKSLFI